MKNIFRLCVLLLAVFLLAGCGNQNAMSSVTESVPVSATASETSLWVPVSLYGGSGKASVESPAELRPENGGYTAVVIWNSSHYDYMLVDGEIYYPVSTEGNSVFELPVPATECTLAVKADTTAMSTPHLIDYTLTFGGEEPAMETEQLPDEERATTSVLAGLQSIGSMSLSYAEQYSVDYYEGGIALITIAGTDQYLLVPEGVEIQEPIPVEITVLRQPLQNLYLASSSAMDMFAASGALDTLRFSALEQDSWYIDAAVKAMEEGKLTYAGKYSAPDYELLRSGHCGLAIENMMITHSPGIVEKLENLGIPVLIEHSSYERTPQGRMEWIRLYGLLTGHTEEAEAAFERQLTVFEQLEETEPCGKTAAFFYVTSGGTVSVRNFSDYLPQMIELAGGTYVFRDLGADSANATTNIQMEEFYAAVKDADYLIYNSTISGQLETLEDFLGLSPLFENLRSVQEGHVYCTAENLYQSSMELGDFTLDLYKMFRDDSASLRYLTKLQ